MVYSFVDIVHEWNQFSYQADVCEYIAEWYTASYDHAFNFVGYRRRGDEESSHSGIY